MSLVLCFGRYADDVVRLNSDVDSFYIIPYQRELSGVCSATSFFLMSMSSEVLSMTVSKEYLK